MFWKRHPTARKGRDEGFVLVISLALTAAVALSAIALLSFQRETSSALGRAHRATVLSNIADAGLTRAGRALINVNDELRTQLFSNDVVAWQFEGHSLLLGVEAESGKVDLNSAAPPLLEAARRAAAKRGLIVDLPLKDQSYRSVLSLLQTCDWFSEKAHSLRRLFTVYSGQSGVTLHVTDRALLSDLDILAGNELDLVDRFRSDPNMLYGPGGVRSELHRPETPVYTIRATVLNPYGPAFTKEQIVFLSSKGPRVQILKKRLSFTPMAEGCS